MYLYCSVCAYLTPFGMGSVSPSNAYVGLSPRICACLSHNFVAEIWPFFD